MNKLSKISLPLRLYSLALFLRLVPVLLTIDLPIGLDDMFQYDMLARSLVQGNGFRWYAQEDLNLLQSYIDIDFVLGDYDPKGILTSFRAPAYPALLALIYSISGLTSRLFAARLFQAFLGASLAPLSYLIARSLFPNRAKQGAIIAGVSMAAYPMLVIYPLALATENLFIPLVSLALLLLLRAKDSQRLSLYALAGITLGAATLTRSVIFGFVGLAFIWIFFILKKRKAAIIFLLAIIALISPWIIRNTRLHNQFVFIESSMGYNLHMGYHPEGNGSFQYGISLELLPYLDDAQRNQLGMEAGLEFIRQDPERVPKLMLNKLGFFMGLERRAITYFYSNGFFGQIPQSPLIAIFLIFTLPFVFIASLSALGLGLFKWSNRLLLPLLLFASYLAPHLLLIAEPRFHLTLMPIMAAFAGTTVLRLSEVKQKLSASPRTFIIALILIGLLFLNWGLEISRDKEMLKLLFGTDGHLSGFSY